MRRKIALVSLLVLFTLMFSMGTGAATPALAEEAAQAEVACESDVVVQPDDSLSKLADRFYGDPAAYRAIFEATNAAAAADSSYATIADASIIEIGWKLCIPSGESAQAMMGDEMAAAPDKTVSAQNYSDTRNLRYCELILNYDDRSDIYNSTGLSECPQDQWKNLDFDAIAQAYGANSVDPNGPQYWMTDNLTLYGAEPTDMGGIIMRFGATLPPPPPGGSSPPPPYSVFSPTKTQFNEYDAGSEVYELIDPDGNVYVLQARKDIVPMESLENLGDQMTELPEGWEYRTRILDEDLVFDMTPDVAIPSTADEFGQVYVRIMDGEMAASSPGEDVSAQSGEPVDAGPLVGDQSVFVDETACRLKATQDPTNNLTNYWPAIGAAEHTDSIHSGVYPCATFTGSFDGPNQVFYHASETNFGDVQFIVFDGPNGAYLMGGGVGIPGSMGQFVSKFNPSSGQEIWRTYLQNANVTGQWIAFGSLGIIKDGTVIAAAGPYVWKLDRDTGDILAYNELPVLGSPAQGANYDGFHVAPDEDGTILMKTQNIPVGCPLQGNGAMSAACQNDYGPQPPTTVVAVDPKTLATIDAIQLEQQVTARPVVTEHNGTIYVYMAGWSTLQRAIWDPDAQKLTVDESWAPEYLLEGQTTGSAPAVLGDWVITNTNTNPVPTPMSLVAFHQDDPSRQVRINPWGDSLPEGVMSMTWASHGVDPENNMIFAQDWYAGGVFGIRLDQETGAMDVVWSRPDWRTSDYFSLVGPADQRVLISQSIGDDFTYEGSPPTAPVPTYSENVVWVDAMTGEQIAQSADTPSTAIGSLPNIGYGGRLYMMGNDGHVFIYQVTSAPSE